jgi:hypothetical protein
MKKMILGMTALALAGATVPTAAANDCGWATAGKILTGVVAGVAIGRALEPAPAYVAAPTYYSYGAPAYSYSYTHCAPPPPVVVYAPAPRPVVCAPPPVVVYRPPVVVRPPAVAVTFQWGGGHWNHGHRGHHRH